MREQTCEFQRWTSGGGRDLLNVQSVSLPKEQRLEDSPDVGMSPMLAHDVRWIFLSQDVGEGNASAGNRFVDKDVGDIQSCVDLQTMCSVWKQTCELPRWTSRGGRGLLNVQSVSLPKEQRLEDSPDVRISPILAHDVRRIFLSQDVGEGNASTGNCLVDKVEGEHVVLLMQLGLELHHTLNHGFIVAKTWDFWQTGTPRHLRTVLRSMICSTQAQAASISLL